MGDSHYFSVGSVSLIPANQCLYLSIVLLYDFGKGLFASTSVEWERFAVKTACYAVENIFSWMEERSQRKKIVKIILELITEHHQNAMKGRLVSVFLLCLSG